MPNELSSLLSSIENVRVNKTLFDPGPASNYEWLASASDTDVIATVDALSRLETDALPSFERFLVVFFLQLAARQRKFKTEWSESQLGFMSRLYEGESNSVLRQHLLSLLTAANRDSDTAVFVDLLVESPPEHSRHVISAFSHLWSEEHLPMEVLFPRLLDGLHNLNVSAVILDFANHITRQGRVAQHPATERVEQLIELLGGLVSRLGVMEERGASTPEELAEVGRQTNEAVGVALSLCDALAQIGDPAAIGKLNQAAELSHRRLRVEACAALARLGDKEGRSGLTKLAAEASVRLRVLAYCDELDIRADVDEEFRSPVAVAEAQLVSCLSEPTYVGVPPQQCELVDSRRQHWPGYEQPQTCYLFKFTCHLPMGVYSNVGISGPLVHCLSSSLLEFEPDDIYAAYAGWQVEHEEIQSLEIDLANLDQATEVGRFTDRLTHLGYAAVKPKFIGNFFGERLLVAAATRDHASGVVVIDSTQALWFPARGTAGISPEDAFHIYTGKSLLRSFN